MAETGHDGEFVQSLERGLTVIRAFSEKRVKPSLSDVAKSTGITRATARRILHTLVQLGYARADNGSFALTPKILELGYAYLSSLSLPAVALPHLEQLVHKLHESSSVSVLDGEDVVYVARVPSTRIMRESINVGTRFPAFATSMGRVLLASQPDEWLDRYLASARLSPMTQSTLTDPARLRTELDRVRTQGWALVDQELERGLRSIAVPIRDGAGRVIAAMNVSAHAGHRSLEEMRRMLLPQLQMTAKAIEADLRNANTSAHTAVNDVSLGDGSDRRRGTLGQRDNV